MHCLLAQESSIKVKVRYSGFRYAWQAVRQNAVLREVMKDSVGHGVNNVVHAYSHAKR